jgi:dihydroflavonol-4-reductase
MKTLVTGGTGFIGSHVVDFLLRENHSVRILSRRSGIPEKLQGSGVEVFQGDLENPASVIDAMSGVDVFYHIGEIKNITRRASEKNVRLLEHVVKNLGARKVKRFVFISSITVAGIPSSIPAKEDTAPEIVLEDHYTSYKRKGEDIIAQASDAEYVIIRPAAVYGPGSRYLGRLIGAVRKLGPIGFPFIGNAESLAPFIYVKDLAKAIFLAGIQPDAAGEVFNLTDGMRHTWSDFLRAIAELSGKKLRIAALPPILFRIPSLFIDSFSGIFGFDLDINHYLAFFTRDLYFDNSKARNLLAWQPDYTLTDGVKEMMGAYP